LKRNNFAPVPNLSRNSSRRVGSRSQIALTDNLEFIRPTAKTLYGSVAKRNCKANAEGVPADQNPTSLQFARPDFQPFFIPVGNFVGTPKNLTQLHVQLRLAG